MTIRGLNALPFRGTYSVESAFDFALGFELEVLLPSGEREGLPFEG